MTVAFSIGGDWTWTGSTTLNGAVQTITATTGNLNLTSTLGDINVNANTNLVVNAPNAFLFNGAATAINLFAPNLASPIGGAVAVLWDAITGQFCHA